MCLCVQKRTEHNPTEHYKYLWTSVNLKLLSVFEDIVKACQDHPEKAVFHRTQSMCMC